MSSIFLVSLSHRMEPASFFWKAEKLCTFLHPLCAFSLFHCNSRLTSVHLQPAPEILPLPLFGSAHPAHFPYGIICITYRPLCQWTILRSSRRTAILASRPSTLTPPAALPESALQKPRRTSHRLQLPTIRHFVPAKSSLNDSVFFDLLPRAGWAKSTRRWTLS